MSYDFTTKRLFVRAPLGPGGEIEADRNQANYLLNVLRMRDGDTVLLFNGHDGEWRAQVAGASRKACRLSLIEQTRPQTPPSDLHYLFAPLKQARLDYMVQKAVEMGAGRIRPVLTRFTQVTRVNVERMEANAVEAAEQCGILSIPTIDAPQPLSELLSAWEPHRRLVFCDESAPTGAALPALQSLSGQPIAVLIGPEGGFAPEERERLLSLSAVTPLSLGPRILRADTAAVAALALVQSTIGDWR